jgi:hypothetical protein
MSKQEFFIEDLDWSQKLETEYEEYMWKCEESAEEEPEDEAPDTSSFTTLSGEAYCGCSTCYTREQLFFLVPRIIKAYNEGKITLNEE